MMMMEVSGIKSKKKNVFCLLIDIVLQNLSEKSTHIHENRNTPKSTDSDVILNIFERKMRSKKPTNE